MNEEHESKSVWEDEEAKEVLHHYMAVVWEILEKREAADAKQAEKGLPNTNTGGTLNVPQQL